MLGKDHPRDHWLKLKTKDIIFMTMGNNGNSYSWEKKIFNHFGRQPGSSRQFLHHTPTIFPLVIHPGERKASVWDSAHKHPPPCYLWQPKAGYDQQADQKVENNTAMLFPNHCTNKSPNNYAEWKKSKKERNLHHVICVRILTHTNV